MACAYLGLDCKVYMVKCSYEQKPFRREVMRTYGASVTSPNSLVYEDAGYLEDIGEEAVAILYPGVENFSQLYNTYAYRNLDTDTLDYINTLWENLKIN